MNASNAQGMWEPAQGRAAAPVSKRGQKTRAKIVAAAIQVFGDHGFGNTTVLDIAQAAGVASGTVYQYFSDKGDIFAYLLQELREKLHRETRMPAGADGRLMVRDSVLAYLEIYRRYAPIFRVWWELLEPPTEFTKEWVALHEKSRGEMIAVIEAGQRQGIVDRRVDSEIAADLIVAAFERPAYSKIVLGWDESTSDQQLADVLSRLLGHGLASAPHEASGEITSSA